MRFLGRSVLRVLFFAFLVGALSPSCFALSGVGFLTQIFSGQGFSSAEIANGIDGASAAVVGVPGLAAAGEILSWEGLAIGAAAVGTAASVGNATYCFDNGCSQSVTLGSLYAAVGYSWLSGIYAAPPVAIGSTVYCWGSFYDLCGSSVGAAEAMASNTPDGSLGQIPQYECGTGAYWENYSQGALPTNAVAGLQVFCPGYYNPNDGQNVPAYVFPNVYDFLFSQTSPVGCPGDDLIPVDDLNSGSTTCSGGAEATESPPSVPASDVVDGGAGGAAVPPSVTNGIPVPTSGSGASAGSAVLQASEQSMLSLYNAVAAFMPEEPGGTPPSGGVSGSPQQSLQHAATTTAAELAGTQAVPQAVAQAAPSVSLPSMLSPVGTAATPVTAVAAPSAASGLAPSATLTAPELDIPAVAAEPAALADASGNGVAEGTGETTIPESVDPLACGNLVLGEPPCGIVVDSTPPVSSALTTVLTGVAATTASLGLAAGNPIQNLFPQLFVDSEDPVTECPSQSVQIPILNYSLTLSTDDVCPLMSSVQSDLAGFMPEFWLLVSFALIFFA